MARKTSTGTLVLVGLVLLGVAYRKAKRGAKPTAFKPWTASEAEAFVDHVAPMGVPLPAVLLVYAAESGLDPSASSGIAYGLPQAIESTLKGIGWFASHKKASEFRTLTVAQQAPWIARLLASQIRMIGFTPATALDLYVANFSPLAAKNRADVIYREGSLAYTQNRNLDRGHKGYISRSDLQAALDRAAPTAAYQQTLAQVQAIAARKGMQHGSTSANG